MKKSIIMGNRENRDDNFEKVRTIIVKKLGMTPDEITEDSSFLDDIGTDTLDYTDIMLVIENDFGVEIRDEDKESFKTVGDVLDHIESH